MFDELLDLFDRDRKRSTGERRRGLGGLIDRLSGENRDDIRPGQRRSDDRDDDRYETRSDRRRSDDRVDDRYETRSDRRRSDDHDDDDDRDDHRGRRRREFELWDD